MTDLNTPERVNGAKLAVRPRSAGTALPMFPPKPEDTVRGPLIVSALPAELPRSLRAAAAPILVAVPLARPSADRTPPVGDGSSAEGVRRGGEDRSTGEDRRRGVERSAGWRRKSVAVGAAGVLVVAVAVLFAWVLPTGEPAPPAAVAPAPVGEFDFHRLPDTEEPIRDSDCAPHAYGRTQEFLVANRCLQLTRAVYSAALPGGRTVFTSVAVVRMRTEEASVRLTELVRQEGTGSVTDLLRDQVVTVPGLDRLSRGGFAAERAGRDVVIVESDTVERDPDAVLHRAVMKRISTDAVRLGAELR
ncbi:hypothetical protein [Actinokineospora spheciospongiae]|uniref:hypothetical protein n=1 Tax=Actinokineospora spheciospongiae TaxID=909613 RepID=UPI000DA08A69|nr:hypothetical protein [Actinokineospora spheciospongiae]PWW54833.1 hypothetical protein DFQ13_11327 [Actinokineospora spheciospongiae]